MPSGRHSRTLTWGRGNSPHVDITAATPDQSFASSMMDHAPSGSLARAVQLAGAYDIEHHSHQPGKLQQLLRLQGNMRTRYQRGIKQMGGFLTKYPEAAAVLLQWARQDAMSIDQFVDECNAVLTMQPSVPTNSAITATTVQPGNNPNGGAINSKKSCDKGLGAQRKGSTEVKGLAVALTTSEDPPNHTKFHQAPWDKLVPSTSTTTPRQSHNSRHDLVGHPNALDGCTAAAAGNRKGDSAMRSRSIKDGARRQQHDSSSHTTSPTRDRRYREKTLKTSELRNRR